MKKFLRTLFLLTLTMFLLHVSALADTGPKPQLTVKLRNAPEETYYLDLLAKGEHDEDIDGLAWSYSEEEITALDRTLLAALRAAVPEGWHACTVEGTNGAPMWGDICGEDAGGARLHTFGYHGVPEEYRILIVTKSGESWVSQTLHRAVLQSSVTVDWTDRTAVVPHTGIAYALQFFCMLLPTLLIEGALLFLFGYRSRRSFRTALFINLITQGGFALYLAVTVLSHGVSAWSLLFYVPIEIVITIAEVLLDRRFLRERGSKRALIYAVAANLCSATVGLWMIDPLWRFIVSIS